jgi:putative ABC transport system substrate-binding protein
MRRREIITLLGGAAAAWPVAAWAQKPVPVVGLLTAINLPDWATNAIRAGLGEAGYVAGGLTMSVLGPRPEVIGAPSKRRF